MSWFVVGGIAVGATAGAIVGSKKGGDDVWKDALIGGAIGGVGAGVGAAFAPAAEAALPAVAGEGGAGILGAEGIAGGAMAPELIGVGGSMAAETPAGIAAASQMVAPEAAAAGGFGSAFSGAPAEFAGSNAAFGSTGAANIGEMVPSVAADAGGFGSPFANASNATFGGSNAPFGAEGGASGWANPAASSESITLKPGESVTDALLRSRDAGNTAVTGGAPEQSALEKGFNSAKSWLSEPKNAMLAGTLGLGALSMFNSNNQNNFGQSSGPTAGYPLSSNFRPSRYEPTRRRYADGGEIQTGMYPQSQMDRTQFATPSQMPISREIIGSDYDTTINPYTGDLPRFAGGGSTKNLAMIDTRAKPDFPDTPDWVRSRGIYRDDDEDTAYQDALTAAQTRMGKAAGRANVQLAAMQKPTPMGKLNLGPVAGREEERKASGGITGLGGYAHGGNPRLLRGPGDGMSDDIPATIADKQPARLADGEFVVPADVVSGLGNGSTEAGAKKLHEMMDDVRVARTGTKKQGKEIKADKFIPGKKAGGIASYAAGGDVKHYASGNLVVRDGQIGTLDSEGGFSALDLSSLNTSTAAPTAVNATANSTGYDPNYYNPQYYQSQLAATNDAIKQAQATLARPLIYGQSIGREDQTVNLTPGTQVIYGADGKFSAPMTVGDTGQIYLHNSVFGDPNVGVVKQGYLYNPNGVSAADYAAAQKQLTDQQALAATYQQNLERLLGAAASTPGATAGSAGTPAVAYTPYTIANRPSAAEPQFYGNIYQEHYGDYAKPGYDMNANLGVWNNEFGGSTAPTAKQNRIAQMGFDQQAASQQSLENAQAAALKSRQLINENQSQGLENAQAAALKSRQEINRAAQPKRKGGILAAKKK